MEIKSKVVIQNTKATMGELAPISPKEKKEVLYEAQMRIQHERKNNGQK